MDEFELIDRYFARRIQPREDVRLGIGDDAAVTRIEPGRELVIATDALVEGTHFPVDTPAASLGHRCLAVNLSDLAAMGARPLWYTLALSVPEVTPAWLEAFATGLHALADEHSVALIGGDTVRGPLAMTVTVHGSVPAGSAVTRRGAHAGDGIYVTGEPGAAAAGLAALQDGLEGSDPAAGHVHRFLYPAPRVAAGRALRELASAMIDVSDGLAVDLGRLLTASRVGAVLDLDTLPLNGAALEQFGPARAREFALGGGDDYELCFTVPPGDDARLHSLARRWSCRLTRLGDVVAGTGLTWRSAGQPIDVTASGWTHFAKDSA